VHWWNPKFSFQRFTIEDAQRFVANHQGDLTGLIEQCFQWCVIPRWCARAWFEAEGWPLPPWLQERDHPTHRQAAPNAGSVETIASAVDAAPPIYNSGGQGRPSSMNLVRGELERRRKKGLGRSHPGSRSSSVGYVASGRASASTEPHAQDDRQFVTA
jgi:hypothetical protein